MDLLQNARELEIDKTDYYQLAEMFRTHTEKDLAALQSAMAESDFSAVHAAAHSIKGASGGLAFEQIYEAATRICSCALQESPSSIDEDVAVIRKELGLLERLLREGPGEDGNAT